MGNLVFWWLRVLLTYVPQQLPAHWTGLFRLRVDGASL